jgi:hypothetical protein
MDAMFDGEMRLFLEELCCELCRFRHAADNGIDPDEVNIAREVQLAPLSAFADIVVTLPAAPAYFVEIKYGLSLEETVRSIRRKYSANHRTTCNRLVVVVRDHDAAALQTRLRECVCSSLNIEIWDEAWLLREIKHVTASPSTAWSRPTSPRSTARSCRPIGTGSSTASITRSSHRRCCGTSTRGH